MGPHLTTALVGPLQDLERRLLDRMPDIERWLRTQWQEHAVPFYTSVDLRNAGFKLAPVDTNLSPGGFSIIGGFYRVHPTRGTDENLNAPGAQFVPLTFEAPCIPDLGGPAGCAPNRFYAYGVVARLERLAAAIEVGQLSEAEALA